MYSEVQYEVEGRPGESLWVKVKGEKSKGGVKVGLRYREGSPKFILKASSTVASLILEFPTLHPTPSPTADCQRVPITNHLLPTLDGQEGKTAA